MGMRARLLAPDVVNGPSQKVEEARPTVEATVRIFWRAAPAAPYVNFWRAAVRRSLPVRLFGPEEFPPVLTRFGVEQAWRSHQYSPFFLFLVSIL